MQSSTSSKPIDTLPETENYPSTARTHRIRIATAIITIGILIVGIFVLLFFRTDAQVITQSKYSFTENGTPTLTTIQQNMNYMMNYTRAELDIIDQKLDNIREKLR